MKVASPQKPPHHRGGGDYNGGGFGSGGFDDGFATRKKERKGRSKRKDNDGFGQADDAFGASAFGTAGTRRRDGRDPEFSYSCIRAGCFLLAAI